MKLKRFVKIVDTAYDGDGAVAALHEDKNYITGDGLADFVYYEMKDAFTDDKVSLTNMLEYSRMLERAVEQLEHVAVAVQVLIHKERSKNEILSRRHRKNPRRHRR